LFQRHVGQAYNRRLKNRRSFGILCADFARQPGNPVNFAATISPESDSRAINLVPSILDETEEGFRPISDGGIENAPTSTRAVTYEAEHKQQLAVKLVGN